MMHGQDDMKKKAAVEALQQLVHEMMGLEGKDGGMGVEEKSETEEGESPEFLKEHPMHEMEESDEEKKAEGEMASNHMSDDMESEKKDFMSGAKRQPMKKTMMVMMKMSKAPKKGKKAY